ncbi:MAG TPA: 2-dehydro-3-deoxygalactonokinase [Aliidongia sp.]|uniref:2-dehydro-3-deoxygalactonokinase n=1 Tax=Aliidongia sp. TaxID=1914230 RepID=UPI002DDD2F68|nr:2-dehydro-3-deoxygalactonokinase [Aliidongia sp.]HEV2675678.1 2-dehydro-3-deoxygalactonokinase [Aliidongia sp.]
MIAVDWGTSSFRAYRLGADGTILATVASPRGILSVADGRFDAVLREEVGPWLDAERLMLLSGMIGSRQGWREAPYAPCPAGEPEIRAALTRLDFDWPGQAWLAPGLTCRSNGVPDVMRGEEVQILGALDALDRGTGLVCLPGTHSKWVRVEDGRITGFQTHMTGESFAVLRQHSILGRLMPAADAESDPDDQAFAAGLARARTEGGLLHHLFGVRSLGLMGDVPTESLPAYLSGLLIGHELAATVAIVGPVHLIGNDTLTRRYGQALTLSGRVALPMAPDRAAAGLHLLSRGL